MKRFISLLLVLVMAFPMQGYASEKVEVKVNNSHFRDVDYTISSPQELVDFNWGDVKAGEKVVLTNDINMRNYKYNMLYNVHMKGTFDGQGHSISNLNGGESSLFHAIDSGGMVKNLVIRNSSFKDGAIVKYNWGDVDNCHVIDTVITGKSGGLVNTNYSRNGVVVNCSFQGTVSSEYAGLVRLNNGEVCNSYCFNGKLIGHGDVGDGDVFNSYSVEELQETTDMDGLLAELNSNQRDRWLEWEIRPQESPYPQLVKMVHVSQCSITVSPDSFVYDGIEKYPDVKVTYGDKELVRNKDYELVYSDNIDVGMAKVKVCGLKQYVGCVTESFVINQPEITCKKTLYKVAYGAKPFKINATSKSKMTFTSSKPKIAAVNKNTGKVTIKNTGVATITIKAGKVSKKVTIKVSPRKPSVKSANTSKGKKLTVKWAKDKMASGYQVQISTDKKFKKNVKSKSLLKTAYTFTKLKTGKKYYVRIRSYKKSGKETLYSAWSKAKVSGKIKK